MTTAKKPELFSGDLEALKAKFQAQKEAEAKAKEAREEEALRILVTFTEKFGKREEKWDAIVTPDEIFVIATNESSDVQWQLYQAEVKKTPDQTQIPLQALVAHHIVYPSKEAFHKACAHQPVLAERIGQLYLLPLLRGNSELTMGEF